MTTVHAPFKLGPESSVEGRCEEFQLEDMNTDHSSGLDLLTRTIFFSDIDFCDAQLLAKTYELYTGMVLDVEQLGPADRNKTLVTLVRGVCKDRGWIAGWKCFSQAAPAVLRERLADDVVTCAEVYSRIRVSPNLSKPIDVGVTVKSAPNIDSLREVGPKGLGGNAWKVDPEYQSIREKWTIPGFAPIGPATAFGWNGLNKKTVIPEDREACKAMQMLGTIDYDFDLSITNNAGFQNSMAHASHNVLANGKPIQGGAVAALINSDLQRFVRSIQQRWVSLGAGSFVLGPTDVSVEDWVKMNAIDCSAIMGMGYESPELHVLSRKGIFLGNLLANMHDALNDMGCSSRVSCTMYAVGGGIKRSDIHNATSAVVIGCFDTIARRILNMSETDVPGYGDSMGIYAGSWSAFNGRYRTFERLVKYTRQLKRSQAPEAAAILEAANKRLVLVEEDGESDIAFTWGSTFKSEISKKLTERVVKIYTPLPGSQILDTPGVDTPELCEKCSVGFQAAINKQDDEVHAIPGLPLAVTSCKALGLAAAIRRSAIYATTDECCDKCACRIGNWGDSVAYKVLVALMVSEEETTPKEWMLQNYIVACVDFWPICIPTILG